jgi:hypothetical protein
MDRPRSSQSAFGYQEKERRHASQVDSSRRDHHRN